MNDSCVISKFEFGIVKQRLTSPYRLSFATLEYIDSIWVYIEDEEGQKGLGEAVPLLGYGNESTQDIVRWINDFRQECIGKSIKVSFQKLYQQYASPSPLTLNQQPTSGLTLWVPQCLQSYPF